MAESRVYELNSKNLSENNQVIVAGDIHGDFESFSRICRLFDARTDYLIFLGDYADRGSKGIEVIDGVNELLATYPAKVLVLKGNHEDYTREGNPKFSPCDLMEEARLSRGGWRSYFEDKLDPFLDKLYLAILIPNEVLFVHGGISSKLKSVEDLKHPSKYVEEDVLWSDPFEGDGEYPNIRGAGVEFGNDISEAVCRRLGVKRIVRSHQPTKAMTGPCLEHGGRVITISSTIVYGGTPFVLALPANKIITSLSSLKRYVVALT